VDQQDTVSFLGWVTFSWAIPLLHASKTNDNLSIHDLNELGYTMRARNLFTSFVDAEQGQNIPRLWLTIARSHAWSLVAQMVLSLSSSVLVFLPRLALLGCLQTLERSSEKRGLIWLYIAALGITSVISNTVTTWKNWMSINIISLRVYAQLASVIYEKGLRLSGASSSTEDDSKDTSQVTINIVTNDAKAIAGFVGDSYQLLETPVKLICCCTLLLWLLGLQSILAGLVIVLMSGPAQVYIAKWTVSTTISMLGCRDERMSMVSELVQGIRQVKFLAAEEGWEERINHSRDREVSAAFRTVCCNVLLSSLYLSMPILLAVVMLSTYAVTHANPSASAAFTSLAVLGLLEQALDTLPALQMRIVNVVLFSRRIEQYLQQPDRASFIKTSKQIEIEGATIVWPGSTTGLTDLNLQFPQGQLSIITGDTGSGKSLLLSCIIGECELISGTIRAPIGCSHVHLQPGQEWLLDDAIAYVAQTAWIQSGTIKDNITFGCPFVPERYEEVLFACALYPDLDLLKDGNRTEIGGNGVNLSGGQRSRISLARALYSRARTLVMDDIFSAVDVHTAKHLYTHALTGKLASGRTRILATYQIELCSSEAAYLVTVDGQGYCQGQTVDASWQANHSQSIVPEQVRPGSRQSESNSCYQQDRLSEGTCHQGYQNIRNTILSRGEETGSVHADIPRLPLPVGTEVRSVQWSTMRDFFRLSGGVWHWTLLLSLFVIYGCLTLGRVSEILSLLSHVRR
jgi:ABC-type bacteriocin/lantibiotic exporter with double-glycine peptidase domain